MMKDYYLIFESFKSFCITLSARPSFTQESLKFSVVLYFLLVEIVLEFVGLRRHMRTKNTVNITWIIKYCRVRVMGRLASHLS